MKRQAQFLRLLREKRPPVGRTTKEHVKERIFSGDCANAENERSPWSRHVRVRRLQTFIGHCAPPGAYPSATFARFSNFEGNTAGPTLSGTRGASSNCILSYA